MKKIIYLSIINFFFYLSSQAMAGCQSDVDKTIRWVKSSQQKYDYYTKTYKWQYSKKKDARYILWTFKNKTKNQITFTRVGLLASDNTTSMKERKVNLYVKPFGVTTTTMYVGDLNLDVSGNTVTYCIYGQPKKSSQPLYKKPSTQKKYTYKKPKKYDDNFTLFNLFLLLISGLLIAIFVAATKKNEYKRYVKNFPIIFDFADNTIACFKKYSTFQGKSSRKEFWYFYLFTFIVSFLTYLIDVSIFRKDPDGILFINTFFAMITFLPSLAAGCRRLHDVNKSGWWQLISITVIGIIPLIIWLASKPVKEKNNY